jgi:restriction system protein
MAEVFDKHGGFRKLHSFTLATIIQLETLRFCRRFLTWDARKSGKLYDPKGRQYDQMTQAGRSGRQNIIEGSERSSTSKDTEMKLTDVARASLSELRGDFEIWILDRGQLPWSAHSSEAKAVNAVSLDAPAFTANPVNNVNPGNKVICPASPHGCFLRRNTGAHSGMPRSFSCLL